MRAPILLCLSALALPGCSDAQPGPSSTTRYEISFENRAHHEAGINVTFTDLGAVPIELRMSRTSPDRYVLHEFAKNVYNFRATGRTAVPLRFPGPTTISGQDGRVDDIRLVRSAFAVRVPRPVVS